MITAGFSSRVGMETGPEVPRPTQDLRPQLDRPSHKDNSGSSLDNDDLTKSLRASDQHDSGDHHGGDPSGSDGGGKSSGGSDSGDHSGSGSGSGGNSSSEGGSGTDDHSGDDHHHGGKPPEWN